MGVVFTCVTVPLAMMLRKVVNASGEGEERCLGLGGCGCGCGEVGRRNET